MAEGIANMSLQHDCDIDFDMTTPEKQNEETQAETKSSEYRSKQRRMGKLRDMASKESNNDFDIPAEKRENAKSMSAANRLQRAWTKGERVTQIHHLQNKIMTANWEPTTIAQDSEYESDEKSNHENRKASSARELHKILAQAERTANREDQNSQNKSETARNLHSTLEISEETHDNKLKAATELHAALARAELETPATESKGIFQ
jgi:hypothetical protein